MVATTKYKGNPIFLIIKFCCRIGVKIKISGGSSPFLHKSKKNLKKVLTNEK